jgi:hypothetical protein
VPRWLHRNENNAGKKRQREDETPDEKVLENCMSVKEKDSSAAAKMKAKQTVFPCKTTNQSRGGSSTYPIQEWHVLITVTSRTANVICSFRMCIICLFAAGASR